MRYGMIETQHIGMQAQALAWIITITILDITTHRMPHISCMNTNLILTARFEFELHQRMSGGTL